MNETAFGTMSTKRLFSKCAIPSAFAIFFTSINTVADGIFIGKFIGADAMAAVNIIMPVILIVFAISEMVGAGSSVYISIELGRGNTSKANRMFSASILTIICIGAIIGLLLGFLGTSIIQLLGADEYTSNLAFEYCLPFAIFLPLIMVFFAIDNYLRICGKTTFSMWLNIFTSLLNILLNYTFIVVLDLSIAGAAYATATSTSLGALIASIPFVANKLSLKFTIPKVSPREMLLVFYNGCSEFFAYLSSSVISLAFNFILLDFGGVLYVAAFSIVMYVYALITPVIYGVINSVQPAVSYNLGIQQYKRISSLFHISLFVASIISILSCCLFFFFPSQLASIFATSDEVELLAIARRSIIIFAPGFLFSWISIVISMFMTSLDKPGSSLIIMLLTSVILPITLLAILTPTIGVDAVFLTIPVSQIIGGLVSIPFWLNASKQVKRICNYSK